MPVRREDGDMSLWITSLTAWSRGYCEKFQAKEAESSSLQLRRIGNLTTAEARGPMATFLYVLNALVAGSEIHHRALVQLALAQ
jgi:hypothetical protein